MHVLFYSKLMQSSHETDRVTKDKVTSGLGLRGVIELCWKILKSATKASHRRVNMVTKPINSCDKGGKTSLSCSESWLQQTWNKYIERNRLGIPFLITPNFCKMRSTHTGSSLSSTFLLWKIKLGSPSHPPCNPAGPGENTCFHTVGESNREKKKENLICIPVLPPRSADRSPMWHVCNAPDRCVRRRVPIPANITAAHRVAYEEGNIGPQLATNSLIQSQFIATCLDLVWTLSA